MFLRELRYAVRMLARTPGFTAVAALSVALGIGANSALFSMHDAILLRPLPVPDPGHVVTLNALSPDDPSFLARLSYPNYRDLRGQARSFDGLVAFEMSTFSFGRSRDAVRDMRLAMMVSDNFFDVLGIQPALGRRFAPGEGRVPGRDAIVVLGHDFWQNTLAGDASLLNAVVVINGIEFTVIGVAPASFTGLDQFVRPAFYVPLMMSSRLTAGLESGQESATENRLEDRTARSFIVKGRLKSGVSLPSAQGELTGLWKQLDQQYPEANRNRTITVRTELQERIRAQPRNAILTATMTTLAAIVLMIACANVANLMLGRARARSREIAVRLALGITRMQLLRQLLTESLLLALLGGLLGVGFGYAGIQMLLSFLQTVVPTDVPVVVDLRLDHRVLAFSFLAALVSAALFGLAPAWQSLNTPLVPALKSSEFSDVRRRRTTIGRNVLVIAQIALSMILLVAAGMLEAGFRKTLALDPGFRTDHLMMMSLNTSHVRYTSDQTRNFYRNLVDGARALPGAASVTLTSAVPLDRGFSSAETLVPEGYQFPQGQETAAAAAAVVDEHYFATMKTDVIRGRAFTPDDHAGSRRVAIVNEQFALTYWPGQEPIGKRIRLTNSNTMVEVVGLTPTEKYRSIVEPPTSFLYLPFAQHVRPAMSLLVETTTTDATGLAPAMRELVRSLNAGQPISNLRTFASFYRQQAVAAPLLLMRTTVTMGLLGLTLALVGLYGVVAYSVARRTREIGIRMAIGAARSDVLVMILRQGLGLAVAGVLVGGAASLAFARLLTAGTAGIGAVNPATYVIVPIALIGLTMVASYFPARRAARVDPLLALRYE